MPLHASPAASQIMDILGLDREDDSLSGTPHRVAKMYVQEIFRGLNPANRPVCRTFDNVYRYSEMLVERNITLNSTCEHHFLPVVGRAHVAYFSSGRVIGLSKLNRVVDHFARRPQVPLTPATPRIKERRSPPGSHARRYRSGSRVKSSRRCSSSSTLRTWPSSSTRSTCACLVEASGTRPALP